MMKLRQQSTLFFVMPLLAALLSPTLHAGTMGDVSKVALHYPTFINDARYLYAKVKPVLKDISEEDFIAAHAEVARPDWVGEYKSKKS